jgi:integrase
LQVYGRKPDGTLVPRTGLGTNNLEQAQQILRTWQSIPGMNLATAARPEMQPVIKKAERVHEKLTGLLGLAPASVPASAPQEPGGVLIGQAVERFLRSRRGDGKRAATLRSHRKNLGYLPQAMPLAALDMEALEKHREARLAAVQQSSWGVELASIRALCAWCIKAKLMRENPAKDIEKPPSKKLPTLPFTDGEVDRLLAACSTPVERAAIMVLMRTGLRVSDVTMLRRDALSADGHIELTVIKTGQPITLPLDDDVKAALKSLPPIDAAGVYWFWNQRCTPESAITQVRCWVAKIGKRAGVAHAHPHRFRDTAVVGMQAAGVDFRTIQMVLGHASIQTTERHYGHKDPKAQARIDAAVLALRRPAPKPVDDLGARIDAEQRYAEFEQPEVAEFLGHSADRETT